MAKATKQVSTKTKARKPAKRGKRKQAAKALQASTAAVKRGKPAAKPAKANLTTYDLESWLAGYEAALYGKPIEPPKKVEAISRDVPGAIGARIQVACDKASWLAGYAEGASQNKVSAVVNNIRRHSSEAANRSDWCGVGTTGFSRRFMQGMRLAALHSWRHDEPRPTGV